LNWLILQIVILVSLAVIIGLFKNYYLIIGSVIAVVLFVILKRPKHTVLLVIVFGISLLTSTLISEFTKIQLLPLFFPPLEEKGKIFPIYRDKPDGEYYRFNNKNPNDLKQIDETNNKEIFSDRNPDGGWKVGKGTTRIDISTKEAGILTQEEMMKQIETWNFSRLDKQGYWLNPSDWKNIEFTVILKIREAEKRDQGISVVSRSIIHDSKGEEEIKKYPNAYCGGSSYHNNISADGRFQMKKEQYHVGYVVDKPNTNINLGNLYNKKIGFKAIVYNLDNDSKVKLESFVDVKNEGNGPYVKVHEKIDDGKWGTDSGKAKMDECGAITKGAIISWGSPKIILKTNNLDFDIYDIEVREITPP
jgi:energy-coupling factor transporter transmembrane protein EcfT